MIHNRDLRYIFHLDLEFRVYTACRVNEDGSPSGHKPRVRPFQPFGRTVHVHTETVDTGERQEIFGYTARRVIVRTTRRFSPENDSHPSYTEADGWYIDPPAARLTAHPFRPARAILHSVVNGEIDTPVFTDTGPRENGFRLLVTRKYRSSSTGADEKIRVHTSEDREEVMEFSEETLAPDLFVPPRAFRRALRLPGERPLPFALRMRLGWESLKDTFAVRY